MSKKIMTLEDTLKDRLKAIFEIDKVTFEDPGPDLEQETLFIRIDSARNRVRDGRFSSMVRGQIMIVAQAEKLPIGYMSKCINGHGDETKDLFFYDFEENTKLYNNIVQRGVSFVFIFSSQHDPDIGTITSITTEVEVNP